MAIMAPAPDQAFMGMRINRSATVPVLYPSADTMGFSSGLEKIVEPSACGTFPHSRPSIASSLQYPSWQFLQEMPIMADANFGCSTPEFPRSTVTNDWLNPSQGRFTTTLPPSSLGLSGSRGIMEDARIRDVMSKSRKNLSVQRLDSWGSLDTGGITLDPSKGGLGLHEASPNVDRLAQFNSDPAFDERATKFSSFGVNSEKYVPQIVQRPASGMVPSPAKLVQGAALEEKCTVPAAAASVQPELEAIEGVTEATVDAIPHVEVEVAALQEFTNNSSCTELQPGCQGVRSPSAASPARSAPNHDDTASRNKRKKLPGVDKNLVSPDSKIADEENSKPKRCKGEDGRPTSKGERSSSETSFESAGSPKVTQKEGNQKLTEYSKQDYIHVRARRGQATDSHSLAERVRREKISERMKYLQDLVPGCRKVTGKAVMLDEIINYVQSLQRQVESLSMKVAAVHPAPSDHLTLESLLSSEEVLQSQLSNILCTSDSTSSAAFGLQQLPQQRGSMLDGHCNFDHFQANLGYGFDGSSHRTMSTPIGNFAEMQTMVNSFDNNLVSQTTGWGDSLPSVMHMAQLQQQAGHLGSYQLPVGHMKVEF